jgi:RNA polymerase sigma factor (sigma-70 family)
MCESPEALAARAKNGDKQAFGELYSMVWRDLYRLALYSLRSREEAEDAVQEAATEAFRSIGGLKDETLFRPWMFTILTRCCKRRLKTIIADKCSTSIYELEEAGILLQTGDGGTEDRVCIWNALEKLGGDERLIVLLSVIGNYSSSELSVMLHRPAGTVRSQLHRSFIKLRRLL